MISDYAVIVADVFRNNINIRCKSKNINALLINRITAAAYNNIIIIMYKNDTIFHHSNGSNVRIIISYYPIEYNSIKI